MRVFFYGLFMDERLLSSKGIEPSQERAGFVDGYGLRIGERATLVHRPGDCAYGVVMTVTPDEATKLYREDSVADYLPEPVTVELIDGTKVEATCYNLPGEQVTGANKAYAEALLELASKLGFPDFYLAQIRDARR
jgi:hypothetical protein